MLPTRGETIERKASPKIHHGHHRPAVGLQYLASPAPEMPADQTGDNDERDTPDKEIASSPNHSVLLLHRHRPTRVMSEF